MNFWLVCCAEQDVPCVSAQRQIERDGEWGGRGAGRAQRGGREPLSQYESLFVLLKLSIQKTRRLYLLFSFPLLLFGNRPLLSITTIRHCGLSSAAR